MFQELIDKEVTGVKPHPLNRSFEIQFGDLTLIFKLYGRRSNIILFEKEKLQTLFRSELKQDFQLAMCAFSANNYLLEQPIIPESEQILKEDVSNYIKETHQNEPLKKAISHLITSSTYITPEAYPKLHLLRHDSENELKFKDVLTAVNEYHLLFVRNVLFEQERSKATQALERKRDQTKNYLRKIENKLRQLKNRRSYKEIADIIMANLHQIDHGATEATLFDFYTNENFTVKLKEKLSPQLNAELLYKKSKNEKVEIKKLVENSKNKENLLLELELQIEKINQSSSWKELRKLTSNEAERTDQRALPYSTFWYNNYEIRVGKDARRNDQLTTRFSSKDDLWLHAKDVSGSHVIIKCPSKNRIPKDVIEYAAGLAAYFSKRKSDTLCPVLFTPRKYVRKSKRLAPGMVIIEREEVILVVPLDPNKL
ncbi:MAG: NFACT RNA binding domain-containing protein [Cyclobacteriaceae bacterium]